MQTSQCQADYLYNWTVNNPCDWQHQTNRRGVVSPINESVIQSSALGPIVSLHSFWFTSDLSLQPVP